MDRSEAKRHAGYAAAMEVEDGMVVGLGTGSTVRFAMERLGDRIRDEELEILGVPTSYEAQIRAVQSGIHLTTLDEHPLLDLAIDGADQVDSNFRLIKGRGAALLREKCVADAALKLVIVVDGSKMVHRFNGTVPVEALPFAVTPVMRHLSALGAEVSLRMGESKDGPVVTDNGNFVVDCDFGVIENPDVLEEKIDHIPGVMASGLFCGYTQKTEVYMGEGSGCRKFLP
ncbi:MAG: ribose 5-phosphate isomerase A [Methanoculleaceae archaeon]